MKALITRKIGMTSVVGDNGALNAVTLLSASPNFITQIKSVEPDGYQAIQIGTGAVKPQKLGKTMAGHLKASGATVNIMREFKIDEDMDENIKIGGELTADLFEVGDLVDVTGVSKGKGFAGTIKRHNFKRGRKTHGGRSYRRPGSIGSMYPQKIFKGKKMAGQMGHERVTTKKLRVALVDKDQNVIGVRGAVPGPRKGIVLIKGVK
ncbi:MAG TPA: 50S ribosomal protein L3 [Candidatus Saccharimonadales bacterium]|nr:50S ribosomal protein L3 [Candidatus Saccharimonadales bacterium]